MATQEKLQKSLDVLKNLSKSNHNSSEIPKKKEKIHYCHIITEAISNTAIRVSTIFHSLLGNAVEVFLMLCDDEDADVRMTSEECLNRIIRAANGYIGKIQIELHKEIKKNGSARSLRTALWLFSLLAHRIRPHKGKPYVVNIFPSLIKIIERNEESVHETLASSLPNIMKVLGCFTTENEIKILLKAFLANISNESSVIRRTTSICILSICLNCKNPQLFVIYCLNNLLDTLLPVNSEHTTCQILGIIFCIKMLIPNILSNTEVTSQSKNVISEKLLQIFELCLHYLSHKDHNITNICLETLKVLLECSCKSFRDNLLNEKGFGFHRIYSADKSKLASLRSPSQLSIATTVNTDDNLFSDSELTETVHSDIEKWIDESKLSVMNIKLVDTKEKSRSLDKINRFDLEGVKKAGISYGVMNDLNRTDFITKRKAQSLENTLDALSFSENSSEKSYSGSEGKILNVEEVLMEIDVGNLLDADTPLLYCIRLITKLFLLNGTPGSYIPDKQVRVSVKFLALSCLIPLFELYPKGIFATLEKSYYLNSRRKVSSQRISDILLFRNHPDPQLRGALRNLLGSFLKVVSTLCEENYDDWIDRMGGSEGHELSIQNVVNTFIEGLKDESSTCIRQTLVALRDNIKYLLKSNQSFAVNPILNILPSLSVNPYWLVKVSLCELVSKIDYITIYYITENTDFQEKVLYNVLFELLSDNDQRVRTSAASGIVNIIPHLFYVEHLNEDTPSAKAILAVKKLVGSLKEIDLDTNVNRKHFISHMPFPFNKLSEEICERVDFSLSKIIFKLSNIVLTTTSKNLLNGCIETLSLLSNEYAPTVYKSSWATTDFQIHEELKMPDLLKLCLSLLTNSVQVYALQTHIDILNLSTNLYAGHSLTLLKPTDLEATTSSWSMFGNVTFCDISEQFLHHTLKLLCIFHHVLNDMFPVHPQAKPVLPNLPNAANLSPLKRRKSDLDKKTLTLKIEKDDKGDKKDIKMTYLGSFVQSGHYMKIYDSVKASFVNYKISLASASSKTFLEFLSSTIKTLSVLLEVSSLTEIGKLAEEILGYFRSTFTVDAPTTVEAVQQLLKCLFGTNLAANINEFISKSNDLKNYDVGFYTNVFQKPRNQVSWFIQSLTNIGRHDFEDDSTVMGYLHRKDVKRRSVILTRTSDKNLANYIRIFEPMVIKSLKQYTVTSNVKLQCHVLQLLSQLIQLRVNYCLLDSEQVFIGFVLKQFEFIEEGQIPSTEELIPKIFQFLVHLSYSKQHSKSIIGVPKIIQLCDGLMASGQPAITHCIPALKPIVEDIFLTRNKSNTPDFKELETTREVVLSMLLRLCDNKQVLDLITLILEDSKYCTHNTQKWYEWSKRVFQVVLPIFKQNKLKIDDIEGLVSVKRFILAINPEVFRPLNEIVVNFFQEPPPIDVDSTVLCNWFSKIILLLSLLTTLNEEALLSKINRLKSEFSPASIFENVKTKADPLNVNNNADTFQNIPGELILVRFLFRVAHLMSKKCLLEIKNRECGFIVEQLFGYLVQCSCIFQSGNYPKLSKMAETVLKANIPLDENDVIEVKNINDNFLKLSLFYPVLSCQWCDFLILLKYENRTFWNTILQSSHEITNKRFKKSSINLEVLKIGTTISFCSFLSENVTNIESINWFLDTNAEFLINLYNEAPVSGFLAFVHNSPDLSKKFLENISETIQNTGTSIFKIKALKCIENCHQSQIGTVLKMLIPDMLKFHQAAISRRAANLASRKIEILLTLSMEEVNDQISKEKLSQIQYNLMEYNLVKKNETLVGLLNKLSVQFYDLSPIEFEQRRMVNPEYIKKLKIDRKWYLLQIQTKYNDSSIGRHVAELLNKVEYNEIVSFLSSTGFNKHILRDCLRLGLAKWNKVNSNEECDLLRATIDCLLKDVSSIVNKIPEPHQVFSPFERQITTSETEYTQKITELFEDQNISKLLYSIAKCMPLFSENILSSSDYEFTQNNFDDLIKFSVVCLEYVHYLETQNADFRVHITDICLTSCDYLFRSLSMWNFLALDSNVSWLCSSINSLYSLVNTLLRNDKPLLAVPKYNLKDDLSAPVQATHELYSLTCWLYDLKCRNSTKIPDFLFDRIKNLTVYLARLPLVNSYVMIPYKAWKTGWRPERMEGTFETVVAALPIDLLQDIDILQEYIYRINLFGWTSRQQFEETWMCLLSVLCASTDNLDSLELNDILYASSLAMKSITALLLETLMYPVAGNPNISKFMHVSRYSNIDDMSIGIRKLRKIQKCLQVSYQNSSHISDNYKIINVFDSYNLEKASDQYCCGQVSINYLLVATNSVEETQENSTVFEIFRQRNKRLEASGLDVNSCLQFLIDYFTQLVKPQSFTHIRVLHEAVRSILMISDLFNDRSQFTWLLEVFLELSKLHYSEDEFLHQYLIIGICKAVAVVSPELEMYEQLKKMLVQYLKSPYLTSRIACLYGLLYILEGSKLMNIQIGGISEEMQLILPCTVEYIQYNLSPSNNVLKKSQEHTSLVWSIAFYLIENIEENHMEQNFAVTVMSTAFSNLKLKLASWFHTLLIKGLERLLIVKRTALVESFGKQFLKLALEKMRSDNPTIAIMGTQLLLSYMYTDCVGHLQSVQTSANTSTNPDHLVQTIETLSAIFERIKKGYIYEVEILCTALPIVLDDFFTPSDILTKVIGEFLSAQQPHPKLLSKVVFQVFQSAIQRNQLSLLQDWVVFSLSNFTQSFSIGMATWCLTVFFVSASTNDWLRSYFSYIQTRVGRYEYEDKKMLCIAGADFYNNLTNEKQRQTFVDNFTKVKDQTDTPFNDLLLSL